MLTIEGGYFLSQNTTNLWCFLFMFRPFKWAIFRSQDIYLRTLNSLNHKIGYTKLQFNEISLSFNFPVVYISSLKSGNITYT